MSYAELAERESIEANALAEAAAASARGTLTNAVTAAAKAALSAVIQDDGRGLSEPASDIAAIRIDYRLQFALSASVHSARQDALRSIQGAIVAGYRTDGEGRARELVGASDGLTATFTMTDLDAHALSGYPIQGHPPEDIADHLSKLLRYALDGALAQPLAAAGADLSAIPAAIGEVTRLHGERVGNAVREAYFAGVQAATLALGKALTGA